MALLVHIIELHNLAGEDSELLLQPDTSAWHQKKK